MTSSPRLNLQLLKTVGSALGRAQFGEKTLNHRVGVDIFGFRLVGKHDPVAQHVGAISFTSCGST